ncbi:hypothetical protein BDR26DRAFT_419667 [Obelidium mucronatum]|nr:hypothetical protein BDR26DRAFT_419667 [Obelidium mucronatum]
MPSTDGDRSKKAATVVAGSLDDAAYSSDDSDERLGVGGQNQGFKHMNANLGMRDVGGKPVVMKGDDTNVPFPRLCGATFSMSGQLVCFFSPLPHPAQVKYAAYSLSTRRQQPLFQTYQFTTYPRNYVMFEHFRNFLVQKSAAASSSNLSANNPNRAASALVQSAANRNYCQFIGTESRRLGWR